MYKYVEDKQFLSRMRSLCGEIMQDLCHTLKEEYDIGASFYLVGSGEIGRASCRERVSMFV